MKKTLVYFLIFLLVEGCAEGNNDRKAAPKAEERNDIEYFELSKATTSDTLKTSLFADTVVYIPLETKSESYLKKIHSIWLANQGILVSDVHKLLLFSYEGKLIRRIGNTGNGPGEHQLIFNFEVYEDTIYLSSSGKRSLMRFTFDGVFCDEIQFRGQPVYFDRTSEGKFAWYQSQEGKIYIHNIQLNAADTVVVENGVTIGRYRYVHMERFMKFLQKSPNGLLFSSYKSDTIWKIGSNGKKPAFALDLGSKLLPYERQIEFSEGNFTKWEKTARPYQMAHLVPFSSWILIFQKHYYGEEYSALYMKNRHSGEIKRYTVPYLIDDMNGFQKLHEVIFTNSQSYLVALMSPMEINLNSGNISKNWQNQMEAIKKDDNPILVLMKVK